MALTGATGFIGRLLLARLVRNGAAALVIGRTPSPPRTLEPWSGHVRWRHADLLDERQLREVLEQDRPSVLFHLAAIPGSSQDLSDCVRVNTAGTAVLLQAAIQADVRRVVVVGTAQEYGRAKPPLTEDLPVQPETIYGVTKAAATAIAQLLHAERGAPIVIVRPFNVYGPGQRSPMFVAEAVEAALQGAPFRMSRGDQLRDFVFVEDVVEGMFAAGHVPGIEGRVINLASGQPTAIRAVAERIWELTATPAPLLLGARSVSDAEERDSWASVSVAWELLRWRATTTLEQGLRATIDAARVALSASGRD